MKSNEKPVRYDSPEAAKYRTDIKGWVSSQGIYCGENEHMARWSGCTHMICECGKEFEKGRVRCKSCQAKADMEKFYALPEIEWDNITPVALFGDDRWFFSDSEVLDFLADLDEGEEARLVICEPRHLSQISEDNWVDDLPDDGELPDEVSEALAALNAVIRKSGPVSWWHGKQRIKLEPLLAQLKNEENKREIANQ